MSKMPETPDGKFEQFEKKGELGPEIIAQYGRPNNLLVDPMDMSCVKIHVIFYYFIYKF